MGMCCVSNQEAAGYPGTHEQCTTFNARFLSCLPSLLQALQPSSHPSIVHQEHIQATDRAVATTQGSPLSLSPSTVQSCPITAVSIHFLEAVDLLYMMKLTTQ